MDDLDYLDFRWKWTMSARMIERRRGLVDDLERIAAGCVQERPTTMMTSWSCVTRAAPCLVGNAFGHPEIGEGRRSVTSEVFYIDPNRRFARTLSRWYELGSYEPPEAIPGMSSIRGH